MIPKQSTTRNTWKSEINQSELEDLIDPPNQEEIEANIHDIMKIISFAKKLRKEAYSFSPSKMKKEKRIKRAKKEISILKSQSSNLARENNVIFK
jgi:hypothetical protein